MDAFWTVLSENSDPDGVRFISTLEAKDYPFYAIQVDVPFSWLIKLPQQIDFELTLLQYHPEKSSYTWTDQPGQQILHSKEVR